MRHRLSSPAATPGPRRAVVGVVLALLLLAGALQAPAAQAREVPKAIWGPALVDGVDQFPIYDDLGVDIYQYTAYWDLIAPTKPASPRDPADPAYKWPADLTFAVDRAKALGMRVSVMMTQAPGWSNGGKPGNVSPTDPRSYADFAEALSRRYPSIHQFMVWGEPIRIPVFQLHGRTPREMQTLPPLRADQRADVRRYATLLDVAYGRLKKLSRRNVVVGGNTTTSGDIDPYSWIRNLRLANGKPPRMDLYGHNPFGAREPDLSDDQLQPGTADFSDLDDLTGWIDRYLARAGRNEGLRIFISEYTAPTDVASYEFPYHVTRAVQARWLRAAFRIADRLPRVAALGWFQLTDPTPNAQGVESRTGLIDRTGRKKPAYYVFKRGG